MFRRSMALRSLLIHSLALLGLAPASVVRALSARTDKAEARGAELKNQLAEVRAEGHRSRERADELGKQVKLANADLERQAGEIRELTAALEKWREKAKQAEASAMDRWRDKAKQMDDRLARTVRTVRAASEHLMATETKLDLLEAAINVLDRRTRTPLHGAPRAGSEDGPSS